MMKLISAFLLAFAMVAPVAAQNGPRVPSEFAPRGADSEVLAAERVEALELRITQLEQLLEAQRTLQNRNRLAESQQLRQRLDVLETRLLSAQILCRAGLGGSTEAPATASRSGAIQSIGRNAEAFAGANRPHDD